MPRYQQRTGHPVLFTLNWFDSLTRLSGDKGARHIIRSNTKQLRFCDVDDAGVVRDLDFVPEGNQTS